MSIDYDLNGTESMYEYRSNKSVSITNFIKIKLFIGMIVCLFIYGIIYSVLGNAHLNNFTSYIDGFYFSMTTLSTVGFGDITPKTSLAKIIIMSQLFIQMMLFAILIL